MPWISPRRLALVAGAVLPLLTESAAADVLILRATGPSAARFAPGTTLPDAARVTLGARDQLVLVDAKGTRTLAGPGSFTAAASGPGTAVSLTTLTGARVDRRARIGAVRSGTLGAGAPQRPNIWFVDVGASGSACVDDPKAITLWRAASEVAGSTAIAGPSGATATIEWIKGQAMQPWPAALPVGDGSDYRLSGTGTPTSGTALHFRTVADTPADLQALGGALVARGCKGQIDMLISTTQQGSKQG